VVPALARITAGNASGRTHPAAHAAAPAPQASATRAARAPPVPARAANCSNSVSAAIRASSGAVIVSRSSSPCSRNSNLRKPQQACSCCTSSRTRCAAATVYRRRRTRSPRSCPRNHRGKRVTLLDHLPADLGMERSNFVSGRTLVRLRLRQQRRRQLLRDRQRQRRRRLPRRLHPHVAQSSCTPRLRSQHHDSGNSDHFHDFPQRLLSRAITSFWRAPLTISPTQDGNSRALHSVAK